MSSQDDHHDDHHDHGEFIAHHFDSAEQQFDSGKLGIWVFLVTEILFFSGLFCAYTLYRYHHPEIFIDASQYLDKVLGAINTIVLLFSSLTMAWAVRAAQMGQNKFASKLILITMVCAAMFLGIKAVEYSHKWDLSIFPISHYNHIDGVHHEAAADGTIAAFFGVSQYLVNLSVVPAILLGLFGACAAFFAVGGKKIMATFFLGLTIMMGGYFVGAAAGQVYQNSIAEEHVDHSDDAAHGEAAHPAEPTDGRPEQIGIFFSIYYCMTGLHAIHVIGGMIALSWLYIRCLKSHFRPDYFGPVDYIGLYWHLVDLIWIYLFPLLYLIK